MALHAETADGDPTILQAIGASPMGVLTGIRGDYQLQEALRSLNVDIPGLDEADILHEQDGDGAQTLLVETPQLIVIIRLKIQGSCCGLKIDKIQKKAELPELQPINVNRSLDDRNRISLAEAAGHVEQLLYTTQGSLKAALLPKEIRDLPGFYRAQAALRKNNTIISISPAMQGTSPHTVNVLSRGSFLTITERLDLQDEVFTDMDLARIRAELQRSCNLTTTPHRK